MKRWTSFLRFIFKKILPSAVCRRDSSWAQTLIVISFQLLKRKLEFKNALHLPRRFSGVTEEDLENVTISLRDVQAVLLSMFSAETILIGHSLESDLLALKVTWL